MPSKRENLRSASQDPLKKPREALKKFNVSPLLGQIERHMPREALVRRLRHARPSLSLELANKKVDAYKEFIALKTMLGREEDNAHARIISPTSEIDEVFHLHVLDTEKYSGQIKRMTGRMIHHYPDDAHDVEGRRERLNNLAVLYQAAFGKDPENKEFWTEMPMLEEAGQPAPTVNPEAPTSAANPETPTSTAKPEAPTSTDRPETPTSTDKPEAPAPTVKPETPILPAISALMAPLSTITFNKRPFVEESGMQIGVSYSGGFISIRVESDMTIETVKCIIQQRIGFSVESQRLYYENTVLEDNRSVYEYKIQKGHTVRMELRFRGC